MAAISADSHFYTDVATLTLYYPRASIVLHALLFIWNKCHYPQFLETCERLELVVQTSLKSQFYECPVLGSYFFLVNFTFLLRVDWHDFRLGTWAGKRMIKLSLILLNMNLNSSPKTVLKPEQNTSTNLEPPNTKLPLDTVPSWVFFSGLFLHFHSCCFFILSHSISITI